MTHRVIDAFPYWREYSTIMARTQLWGEYSESSIMLAAVASHTHAGNYILDDDPIRLGLEQGIETIYVENGSKELSAWDRENGQRNALVASIRQVASDGDLIISTDADELVNPEMIPAIRQACRSNGPISLGMTLLYYGLDLASPSQWEQGKAMLVEDMPDDLSTLRVDMSRPVVNGAGWHISWQGGELMRRSKALNFAHTELSGPEGLSMIEQGVNGGTDMFGNTLVPFDRYLLPAPILRNIK